MYNIPPERLIGRGVGNINNYAVINNRNTPHFNHTRGTVNKVSTNFTDCKTRVLAYSVASCTRDILVCTVCNSLYVTVLTAKKIEMGSVSLITNPQEIAV